MSEQAEPTPPTVPLAGAKSGVASGHGGLDADVLSQSTGPELLSRPGRSARFADSAPGEAMAGNRLGVASEGDNDGGHGTGRAREDLNHPGALGELATSELNGPESNVSRRDSAKPSHYKVICISMYTEDLTRLDAMVETLKARGLTKANRSALIRYALGQVDLDRVPKGL